MLSKIWKDPVWSKVIASAIIGISLFVYATVEEKTKGASFLDTTKNLLGKEVKVSTILTAVLLLLIFRWIKGILSTKDKTDDSNDRKQAKLKSNNRLVLQQEQILLRWDVYFSFADKPFAAELQAHCLRHGEPPIRFMHHRCPVAGCENSRHSFDEYKAKNYIESMLTDEWDKLTREQ